MPLVVGAEMQLMASAADDAAAAEHGHDGDEDDDGAAAAMPPARPDIGPRLVLLAMSRRGYANLVRWITVARRRAAKGSYRALMSDLEGRVPDAPMLAGLPGCLALLVASEALASARPFETLLVQALQAVQAREDARRAAVQAA